MGTIKSQHVATAPAAHEGSLVEEKVLVAPATSVTFSGLDGLTHGGYKLEAAIVSNSSSADVLLYVNGDTTGSKYTTRAVYATDADALAEAVPTLARVAQMDYTVGNISSLIADILQLLINVLISSLHFELVSNSGKIHFGRDMTRFVDAGFTNITSLVLTAGAANGFGTGTTFRLYRKK